MSKYIYDIPGQQSYWDNEILDQDLERLEYEKNFSGEPAVYNSILDDEPSYRVLMNFPEEEEDALYAEEADDANADENDLPAPEEDSDRESYKTVDQENMYYFI